MQARPEDGKDLRIDDARAAHIFRDTTGHLAEDTEDNRALLERVANDPDAQLGTDKYGNLWAARTQTDGTQIWTQSRGGAIMHGGVNAIPRRFEFLFGLSQRSLSKE
jgi:filamentous hemagglutinin